MKLAKLLAGISLLVLPATVGIAQRAVVHADIFAAHAHIIVPQARAFPGPRASAVQISEVHVGVEVLEQVATTTLDISLKNPSGQRLEAQMVVPVPEGAVLRGFTFQGASAEPTAEVLRKEDARRIYDSIVAKTRDPALLEFIGFNLIKSSVFPVEAHGTQKVRLTYEHLVPVDGTRVDYVLPRSECIDYQVPWKIAVKIKSKIPIATVYSPSHRIDTTRPSEQSVTVRLASESATEPGPFRLSWLLQKDALSASLLAYPDPKVGGGYFLLLAGAPVKAPQKETGIKREVILVLDRSGSMSGGKLEQVREAALQVLEGLEDGEAFNIIIYHEAVESFAPSPVIKNAETMRQARAYLKGIRVRGGTNIHDALVEALRQKPTKGHLPIVLFLTDGLPTIGQTSEKVIREVATKGNTYERRIFTFGVGVDVNTPLLDRIASETRATATFVLPKEDVEVKVGQVFKRLVGPVLASPKLRIRDDDGKPAYGRTRDITPSKLPDLFEGDQLVLLGQYTGEEPITFLLDGNYFGKERTFKFSFNLSKATTKNAFVPRLWASRKIAVLTDAIRDLGADSGLTPVANPANPKTKELVDEIVRLSKEFGILTEYTAFLAREGTDLSRPHFVLEQATRNFSERAINTRSGFGSVNQDLNNGMQRSQIFLNNRNGYWDENMNRVDISSVQQVSNGAFYRRGNRWVDNSLIDQVNPSPSKVVSVGSEEFSALARRLAEEGRQAAVSLNGEILLRIDGQTVLVK